MVAQYLLIVSDVLSSLIVELSPLFFTQKPWRPVGCLLAHILQALWIGQMQAVCDWDNCCCTVAPLSGHHRVLKPSCTICQVSSECSISDLAATLLHFRKKPWNFLNPFWVSGLDLWPIFYFLSGGGQYSVWVSVHLFWEVLYPSKAFIGWNSDAVFDKISNISHCVLSESCQSDPWIFDLSLNNISE